MLSFIKTVFKILMRISPLIFFVLICLILFVPLKTGARSYRVITRGTINAARLHIHKAPSLHASVTGILQKGNRVKILKQIGGIGGWLKISFKGIRGYVRNRPKYIRLVKISIKKIKLHNKNRKKIKLNRKKDNRENKKKGIQRKNQYSGNTHKAIHDKIITEVKKLHDFTKKEAKIIDGLNDIDHVLNKMRKMIISTSEEIKALDNQIRETSEKRKKLLSEIKRDKAYAETRLVSFYKIKMMGITELFPMPDSLFDFIIQQNYLKRIINSDIKTIDTELKEINTLNLLSKQLSDKKRKKRILDERLKDQIRIMKKESSRRKAILKEIGEKKKLGYAALASLKKAANRLNNRMNSIKETPLKHKTGSSFADYRGRLAMPVKGKIISRFGTERNSNYTAFTFQSGIDIKAERGEPVRSVFKGRVIFAQWLKGYGNMVIIDHGDNYYTLYAHVDEIFKKKGSLINTGEVIATAGDTGSLKGTCLHFEVRFHGKPVNPVKWLKKGA